MTTYIAETTSRCQTRLAYRVDAPEVAEALSTLVFTNGLACSDFYWSDLLGRLRGRAKMVTWDLKGHGRSEAARDLEACTIADSADDLLRVLDAAEVESATLLGFSLGCQIILEAWRRFPDRIDALVPILGPYASPFDTLLGRPGVGKLVHGTLRAVGKLGGRAPDAFLAAARYSPRPLAHPLNQAVGLVDRKLSREAFQAFYDHLHELDAPTWLAMALGAQAHSAEDLLESIEVPTLVVAGGRDLFAPRHVSEEMQRRIPGAQLVMLPTATHAGLLEHPEPIGRAVLEFLEKHGLLNPAT